MRKAGFVLGLLALVLLAWLFFRSDPTASVSEPERTGDPALADLASVGPGDEEEAGSESGDAEPSVAVDLTVVDESGEGVAGARAGVFGPEGDDFGFLDAICQARADSDGELTLSIPARAKNLSLRVCPPTHREELVEVRRALWIPKRETIFLPAAKSVSGIVVAPDGMPVPEASVVWSAGGEDHAGSFADSEGRFTLNGLPPGKVTLTALPDDWAVSRAAGDPKVVERGQDDVTLVLRPNESLIGRIANWPSGRRWFAALSVQHPPGVERRWSVGIGGDGKYRLDGLRPHFTYLMWIGAFPWTEGRSKETPKGRPSKNDLVPFLPDLHTSEVEMEVTVLRGLTIEGRLIQPSGGLRSKVSAWNEKFRYLHRGLVEEDGSFLISGLFPGQWKVRADTLYGHGKRPSQWGAEYDRYERYVGSATAKAGDRVDIPMERE